MAEMIVGVLLFFAALEDLFYQKIFDGFAIGIVFVSLLTQNIALTNMALALILMALSFIPLPRPCWGRGDGIILAALSLYYDFSTIVFFLTMSTVLLICFHIFFRLKPTTKIPLGPNFFTAWLFNFLLSKNSLGSVNQNFNEAILRFLPDIKN